MAKKKSKAVYIIIPIVLFVAVILFFSIKYATQQTGLEGAELLYPLYSSVCCESQGFFGQTISKDIVKDISYSAPKSARVKILEPKITCSGTLTRTKAWYINHNGITYCSDKSWWDNCQNEGITELEIQPNDNVYVQGVCIAPPILLLKRENPASMKFEYRIEAVKLYRYPAGEGKYDISGSENCIRNQEVNVYQNNLPTQTGQGIINKAKAIINDLVGKDVTQTSATQSLQVSGNQLGLGECYVAVDKWQSFPSLFNVNPLGQYQSNDIICSPSKGLLKVEIVNTLGGKNYIVPTTRLSSPDKFCCNHEDCRQTYGVGYNCISYSCKKEAGFCISDVDCQPSGGEIIDKNCYREMGTNNFYKWSSSCSNNKCSTASKESVKCCPSYCESQGLVCDFEKGCIKPIEPEVPCPANKCCAEGSAYIPKECSSGYCCNSVGGVGTCQNTACGEVPKETVCDNGIDDDNDGLIDCADPDCKGKCGGGGGEDKCRAVLAFPDSLGGFIIFPNLSKECLNFLTGWAQKLSFWVAILGFIATIFLTYLLLKKINLMQKNKIGQLLTALFLGFMAYMTILNWFWGGVIIFILYIIITSAIPFKIRKMIPKRIGKRIY